jgi:tetratricopeptide (TPR) repeat protein
LGRVYLDVGFAEKARTLYAEAYSLDGLKASYYSVTSWLEFSNENFEEAVKLSKMAKEIDSTYLTDLIGYLIPSGHENDAYIHAKQLINKSKRTGSLPLYQSHRIGYALIRAGKTKEGQSYLNQQIKYSQDNIKLSRTFAQRRAAHYDLAATYAYLGEKEKAYQYLEEFGKLNFYQKWWLSMAKNDPFFANIREEAQFQKLLQNMQAKHQAEHERVRKWLEEQRML